MKIIGIIVCCFGLLVLTSTPGNAAPTVYSGFDSNANSTDPRPNSDAAASSFDAAVVALGLGSNLITFELAPVGPFSNLVVAPGVNLTGLNGFGSDQGIRNTPLFANDEIWGYNVTSGGENFVQVIGGTITFTFTDSIQAFGAYISGINTDGPTITFNDGSLQSIDIPNPGSYNSNTGMGGGIVFIGFTDFGTSISGITIDALNDAFGVDDVRFASTAVPEPSTMLLVGSGLLGLWGARRKFKK